MILINNTVLSNFALVKELEILTFSLKDIFPVTTPQVLDEFQSGVQKGIFQTANLQWIEIIQLSRRERHRYQILNERFGSGEASCIAVAMERHLALATDDMKARKLLQQFGEIVIGTLWILIRLINQNTLSIGEGDIILERMIQKGYFSPVKSLSELLVTKK
jgi:predicted nucleic acid-binding protein